MKYFKCLVDYSNQFTKGKIYQNSYTYDEQNSFVGVVKDDTGNSNGWSRDKFKEVTEFEYLQQENKINYYELY